MMHTDEGREEQPDMLDLNEVMRAFGVATWQNLGLLEGPEGPWLQLQVEIEGQRYLLKERPEGLAEEAQGHLYAFQHHLAGQGIPIAPLRLTPQGEPSVTLGEDTFE